MQETVRNSSERKSLFSSFLEILEDREKQALAERQLQEEKYLRRTQRIYEFHDRQQREVVELRRCLEYVSQHAHVLETALRGGGAGGAGGGNEGVVPLSAALARQAAPLQRCMAQCVDNAARIRRLLAAVHHPQMDSLLAKMESELSAWTGFLQRAVDATYNSEVVIDNLHNMIAEQRRCVRELSSSSMLSLAGSAGEEGSVSEGAAGAGDAGAGGEGTESPLERRAPSAACSTPLARD